ncbi:hypothetical protein C8F01DRAFT_258493 [Mycena amicta]|nr:hypothetical protein C8F01DRAFT_258493 [Mycena amicta]
MRAVARAEGKAADLASRVLALRVLAKLRRPGRRPAPSFDGVVSMRRASLAGVSLTGVDSPSSLSEEGTTSTCWTSPSSTSGITGRRRAPSNGVSSNLFFKFSSASSFSLSSFSLASALAAFFLSAFSAFFWTCCLRFSSLTSVPSALLNTILALGREATPPGTKKGAPVLRRAVEGVGGEATAPTLPEDEC